MRYLGRSGTSAAEFAVMTPVLILLVLGTWDLGNAIQLSLRLERIARAGAEYAIANSSDVSAIQNFVLNLWPGLFASEVTVICGCAGAAMTSCSAACGSTSSRTVSIAIRRTLTPLLLSAVASARGDATARLR